MDLPAEAARRIAEDQVAWLTTITDSGAPAPNPIWFVADAAALVVFAPPTSRKVHNIAERPLVCLHLNSDPHGGDIVILNGVAELTPSQAPSQLAPYATKYSSDITGALGMTMDGFDATYSTKIRIDPTRVRLTPGT